MILIILFYLLVIILLLSYKPKQRKPEGRWRSENQYSPRGETENQYSPRGETDNQYRPRGETDNQYRRYSPSGETMNRLYNMCGGDRDLAQRLADFESAETEELRWKRAIYRLERDRN